jgi:hypothetical protein
MKLSIVVEDRVVVIDGLGFGKLTLIGVPEYAHALQWNDGKGWVEYSDGRLNEGITALPQWATDACAAHEAAVKLATEIPVGILVGV